MKNIRLTTNLTIGYVSALVILTALSTISYVVLREAVSENVSGSALVNISGRQRMLSQRIVLLAQDLAENATSSDSMAVNNNIRDALVSSIEIMEKSHNALIHGNVGLGIPRAMPKSLKVMYFGPKMFLDDEVRSFIKHAKAFSKVPLEDMVPGNSDLRYLAMVGPDGLLTSLDAMVTHYETESVQHGLLLEQKHKLFFTLTLFTLAIMALGVFRPMVSRIKRDFDRQEDAELKLRENYALIQLLHRTASEANMAKSVDEAFRSYLKSVCEYKGWSVGHAYVRSHESPWKLSSTDIWCLEDEDRFAKFREITNITEFEKGIGLPGRVLATGYPCWIIDVNKDTNFPRAKQAKNIGVKAGFALPVLVGSEVVAVLEFFSERSYQPDDKLLGTLTNIGIQLGRVVERMRGEAALRESEKIKTSIFENALDGIVIMNGEGDVIEFNSSAEKTFGYAKEQALGKEIFEIIFPPDLREQYRQKFHRHVVTGEGWIFGNSVELTAMRPGGSKFPVEISVTVTDLGERQYYTAFIHDLSERRQAEENEQRHLAEMARVGRMSAMGEMATGLAHELNQPLSALNNYARGGLRRLSDDNMSKQDMVAVMEKVSSQAERASKIIHWLRGFVNKDEPQIVPVDINEVSKTVSEILRNEMQRNQIAIQLNLAKRLPNIMANRTQVEQVLINLLLNGMEAQTGVDEDQRQLIVRTSREEDDNIHVSVKDHGPGMSDETIGKIFTPFFTTRKGGMGLGLSICRSVIESHGGHMWVESGIGKGTEFIFTLPIKKGRGDAPA